MSCTEVVELNLSLLDAPALTVTGFSFSWLLRYGNRGNSPGLILGLVQLWSLRGCLVFQEYFCCIFAQAFIGATMWCVGRRYISNRICRRVSDNDSVLSCGHADFCPAAIPRKCIHKVQTSACGPTFRAARMGTTLHEWSTCSVPNLNSNTGTQDAMRH